MRKFTPYEINHLIEFGFNSFVLSNILDLHIPVEYVTGKIKFCNNIFSVNNKVLIPRIETEQLVDLAYDFIIKTYKKKDKIVFADIGTGSGCIGISLAKKLMDNNYSFEAILSDFSSEALEVCKINLDNYLAKELLLKNNSKIELLKSDLLKSFPRNIRFNLIMANLPYIPSLRLLTLDLSVTKYEPKIALDGGKDGLKVISRFLKEINPFINKGSKLIIEVDDDHNNINRFLSTWKIDKIKDIFEKNRFWSITPL